MLQFQNNLDNDAVNMDRNMSDQKSFGIEASLFYLINNNSEKDKHWSKPISLITILKNAESDILGKEFAECDCGEIIFTRDCNIPMKFD